MTNNPTASGPYTPITQAGHFYYISGQVGMDSNRHAESTIEAQCRQAMHNLMQVLRGAHLTPDHVVKTTVFLKYMSDFAAMNEIYSTYFSEPRPARSCVAVGAVPDVADRELLVEIEAVAYREPRS